MAASFRWEERGRAVFRNFTGRTASIQSFMKPANGKKWRLSCVAAAAAAAAVGPLGFPVAAARAQTAGSFLAAPGLRSSSDVFTGQNKTGPYPLAWRGFDPATVAVQVDGALLSPAAYTIDADKGFLTFKADLRSQSVARIDYRYDPARAQRNAAAVAGSPVTISLLEANGARGKANLQVTALPLGAEGAPQLVWGLGGRTSLLGGGFSSQLLLAPASASDGEAAFTDRAGVRLGYERAAGKNRVQASFVRGGKEFSPAAGGAFGLEKAPAQRWALGAASAPAAWLGAELTLAGARDLSGRGASGQNGLTLRLGGVNHAPLVNLSRAEETRSAATGETTSVTTEKVAVTGKIGGASFAANGQRTVTDAPTGGDQTRLDGGVSVSAVTRDKTARAAVAVTAGSIETVAGQETRQAIEVTLQPGPALTIKAQARQQSASTLAPGPAGGAGAARSAVSTASRAATAELTPLRDTKLVGSVRTEEDGARRTVVSELAGEMRAGTLVTLSGGVTDREAVARGSAASAAVPAAAALDTTRVRLMVRPTAGLSLTGSLIVNPEEKNVGVADATRQEWGLAARLGALELGSGYAVTSWGAAANGANLAGTDTGELSLSLGLRFNRTTRLTGGYKDGFAWGAPAASAGLRSYSFGFAHDAGSLFNFSLGGSLTENKAQIGRPADVKAEAKLGIKF